MDLDCLSRLMTVASELSLSRVLALYNIMLVFPEILGLGCVGLNCRLNYSGMSFLPGIEKMFKHDINL